MPHAQVNVCAPDPIRSVVRSGSVTVPVVFRGRTTSRTNRPPSIRQAVDVCRSRVAERIEIPQGESIDLVAEEDPVIVAMPSDHVIADPGAFTRAVARGAELAAAGHIVVFGVPPTAPETGYGYIRAGAQLAGGAQPEARYVDSFVEKPDASTAASYIASGRYLWNSGIFAVRASVWIECITELREESVDPGQFVIPDDFRRVEMPTLSFGAQ